MKLIGSKSLAARITVAIVGFGLITASVTATLSYLQAQSSLTLASKAKLEAVLEEKSTAFIDFMGEIDRDIHTQSENPAVKSAIVDFHTAWEALEGDPTRILQGAYISGNSYAAGEKENLDKAQDGTLYSDVHAAYHPFFRALRQDRGYYDVLLFDLDGNLIYSVSKGLDFATNLNTGQYSSSDLGKSFRVALETGERSFFDFAPYAASFDAPASFIATPVRNQSGRTIGVLSYEMPVDRVNQIMASDTGLGQTGMVYAIGADNLMRSDIGISDETSILSQSVNTPAANDALRGNSGVGFFTDFRGEETITAYRPVSFKGVEWALLAQQDRAEALAGIIKLRNHLLVELGIFVLLLSAIGIWIGRGMTRPIIRLGERMTSMAGGDYRSEVPGSQRSDEIGMMAQSITEFRDNLIVGERANEVSLFKGSAFDGSSMPMMIVDRDLNVTFVNDSTMALFRDNLAVFREQWPSFDPEKIVGMNIDLFHKNPAHQRRILENPKNLPFETDIILGPLTIHLSIAGVFNRAGEYVGNVLQWDDVTDDRLNAGILNAMDQSQAMIEFHPNGFIIGANENFLKATGYSHDEIVGKHHRIFMKDNDANSPDYEAFWKDLASGQTVTSVFERRNKRGEPLWLDATYNAVKNSAGKTYKVVKIATDITESHIAQETQERELARRSEVQNLVVSELAGGLKSLASGDLTHTIDLPFDADYEGLRQDFNATVEQLSSTIARISGSTVNIKTGSVELSRASDDLSKRTENQAASLEETAAALNEITTTVQQSAAAAEEARSVVSGAKADAEAGGDVVQSTVGAMGAIKESSEKISQIIGVIDEIAFQTNLLALNAGVEAARAGEAGRGFAVVASEVRALAQRSSDAAKDIKDLISASSHHVESGVSLVDQTGEALAKIVAQVVSIDKLVTDITTSSKEQATGLAEVNTAVTDMDRVTQRNAAMVEESTAACHALSRETEKLSGLVAKFKVADGAVEAFDDPVPAPAPTTSPVHQQQERAAAFFSAGSSAVKVDPDFDGDQDWQEF
ncbi:MAG: methyl-accepting chemotaxis protein, partial [Pseudomonadota bacterium]